MSSRQQRYRNLSSDSMGRERAPSDDGYYQGMLKALDGRKGTSMVTELVSVTLLGKNELVFQEDVYVGILLRKWTAVFQYWDV